MNRAYSTRTDGLLDCPACGLPAEIVDRFTLEASPHPVEHVKIRCLAGHWFTPLVEYTPPVKPEPDRHDGDQRQHVRGPESLGVSIAAASRVRTVMGRLKEIWDEVAYAHRRQLEIRTGIPANRDGRRIRARFDDLDSPFVRDMRLSRPEDRGVNDATVR
jgi:hypothetical protein